jgi:uncharacterized membrane protein
VKDLCLIAVFAAIISIVGQFSIPLPGGVPMTLQTLIVALAGAVLGSKKGILVDADLYTDRRGRSSGVLQDGQAESA